jgi:tetratricopeptide (TPR) repeat protein
LTLQYFEFDPTTVLADLDQAIALAGNTASEAALAHYTRGWALFNFPLIDNRPNPAAALDDLKQAVALEAQNAEAQFTLAQARLATGQAAEALTPANRALELKPEAAVYFKLRAHIYFALDDFNTALDDLAAAIDAKRCADAGDLTYRTRYLLAQLDNPTEALASIQPR